MFTIYENSKKFEKANNEAKDCLVKVLSGLIPTHRDATVPRDQVLCGSNKPGDIFLLKSGFLRYERDDRLLYFIESGEIAGWGEHFYAEGVRVFSDFAVVVDKFDRSAFLKAVGEGPRRQFWQRYVELNLELLTVLISQIIPSDIKVEPELRQVSKGAAMIVEGTTPNEVFTLLHGEADVFVGDVKVGQVLNGEIFGAMAAASGMTRSASVIAREDCLAMVIPKEHFLELTKTHPHTVEKLIEDMSRVILSQNEKIVAMTRA